MAGYALLGSDSQQSHRAATRALFAVARNILFSAKMNAAVVGTVPVPCCASHPVTSRKTAKQPGLYRWQVSLGNLSNNKQFLGGQKLSCKTNSPSLGFRRRGTLISCSASPKVQVSLQLTCRELVQFDDEHCQRKMKGFANSPEVSHFGSHEHTRILHPFAIVTLR